MRKNVNTDLHSEAKTAKKKRTPQGVRFSLSKKVSPSSRPQARIKWDHFWRRRVRRQKYLSARKRASVSECAAAGYNPLLSKNMVFRQAQSTHFGGCSFFAQAGGGWGRGANRRFVRIPLS